MSEFQASNFKKAQGGSAPDIVGKVEFTSPYFFVPPSGDTASRPQSCAPGTIRFNTDVGTIEVYRGDAIGWEYIQKRDGQYLGGGTGSNTGVGIRGLFSSSYSGSAYNNTVDYITISTLGDAQDFGDMQGVGTYGATTSDSTRAIIAGGHGSGPRGDVIDFHEFATTGNFNDFGDLTASRWLLGGGCSDKTRSIFTGGSLLQSPNNPVTNILDYVTTQSQGNAQDFGDQTRALRLQGSVNSSTRGLWSGGYSPNDGVSGSNIIDYVDIATTGDAVDFGDLTEAARQGAGMCNATRGVFQGNTNTLTNTMAFVTMATLGNAIDFGDSTAPRGLGGAVSSPTRGVFGGGYSPATPSNTNSMEFISFATTGNSTDFGDLTRSGIGMGGISNGHGGL